MLFPSLRLWRGPRHHDLLAAAGVGVVSFLHDVPRAGDDNGIFVVLGLECVRLDFSVRPGLSTRVESATVLSVAKPDEFHGRA